MKRHIYNKHFALHKTDNSCLFGLSISTVWNNN